MNELKTLKDIEFDDCTDVDYNSEEEPSEVLDSEKIRNELRDEAIKWYKKYEGDYMRIFLQIWIKDFFNLTEKDIK